MLCGYQIWVAIHKYFQYQTTVSVQIRHMTNITFPAVTICNLNPIRSSWLVKSEFSLTLLDELKKSAAVYFYLLLQLLQKTILSSRVNVKSVHVFGIYRI